MKKSFIKSLTAAAIILSAGFIASCEEGSGLVVTVNQSQNVIFKLDSIQAGAFDTTQTIAMNLDSILTANSVTRDQLQDINFKGLVMTIVDSTGATLATGNFNALDSVSASVSKSSPIAYTALANLKPVPQNTNPIILSPVSAAGISLTEYVVLPSFLFKMSINVPTKVTTRTFIKAEINLAISVQP